MLGCRGEQRGEPSAHIEAEGVPSRVEHHPHVVLWLVLGQRGTQLLGVLNGRRQVPDLKVQVHHHLLLAHCVRPGGPLVALRGLRRKIGDTVGGRDRHVVRSRLRLSVPTQQVSVERANGQAFGASKTTPQKSCR